MMAMRLMVVMMFMMRMVMVTMMTMMTIMMTMMTMVMVIQKTDRPIFASLCSVLPSVELLAALFHLFFAFPRLPNSYSIVFYRTVIRATLDCEYSIFNIC